MLLFFSTLFFLAGIVIGSFLDVLIDRIPRGESIIRGRSHCDFCRKTLRWYDLIPLVSFIFLEGRCRYCHKKIGWQNFIVQLVTGLLFIFAFITVGIQPVLLYVLFFISCFLVIAVVDIKHGIIPNAIVYLAIIISLSYHFLFIATSMPFFLSAIFSGLFFFLLFTLTKGRGMGFGDVKLAFLLGLFLGYPHIIISLYIAFLTGAVVACILIVAKKKKFSKGTIAFGPFLVLGAFLSYFYGGFLWQYVLFYVFRL